MANGNGNGNEKISPGEKKVEEEKKPEEIDYKDRLIRLAAEFDNYKKKVRAEAENAKMLGKAELVRDLLSVLDEFELALMSIRKYGEDNLAKGIELLYSNFMSALKKEGLSEIKAEGKFDPYKHEIMMAQEGSGKKPGTILEVTKKGYMLREILLRPASVIVAKEPEEKKEEIDTKK